MTSFSDKIASAAAVLLCFAGTSAQAQTQLSKNTLFAAIGGANAMSPPSARHVVRAANGKYVAVFNTDLNSGNARFYWSDDDWQSFQTKPLSLTGTYTGRDTVDMVALPNNDLLMVVSWDYGDIKPDAADPMRKIVFQRWTPANGSWNLQNSVTVMDPCPGGTPCASPGYAYHRGEIAVDSQGRIWVQAFLRKNTGNATIPNGDGYNNELELSVSTDGGASFNSVTSSGIKHGGINLGSTSRRAGGRLIAANQKLLMIWNDYSEAQPTQLRWRNDADPTNASWSSVTNAFSNNDGIYHGAALSAATDGVNVHLAYKDQASATMKLRYSAFNWSTMKFPPSVQLDDVSGDWAQQPATVIYNGELFIFTNHRDRPGNTDGFYTTRMWRQGRGFSVAQAYTVDNTDSVSCSTCYFNGYPASAEYFPPGAPSIPYFYGRTGGGGDGGNEALLRIEVRDFVITASPNTFSVDPGDSIGIAVSNSVQHGYNQPIALTTSISPQGPSLGCPQTMAAAGSVSCTFATGTAQPGTYTITITGTSSTGPDAGLVRTTTVTAVVTDAGDFSFSLEPTSVTLGPQSSATVYMDISSLDLGEDITFSASGLPSGATLAFDLNPYPYYTAWPNDFVVSSGSAAPGTYTLQITGTGAGRTHSVPFTLTVTSPPPPPPPPPPDFSFSLDPTSVTLGAQSSATVYMDIDSINLGEDITFSVSGLPPNAGLVFELNPYPYYASWQNSFVVSSGTASSGSFPLQIIGTGGGKTHSVPFTLTINAPPQNTCSQSCAGCCDASGNCRGGDSDQVCGNNGEACQDCTSFGYVCYPVEGNGFCY